MLLTRTASAGQKNWRKGLSLNQLRRMSDHFLRAKKSCRPLLRAFIVISTGSFLRRRFRRYLSRGLVRLQSGCSHGHQTVSGGKVAHALANVATDAEKRFNRNHVGKREYSA